MESQTLKPLPISGSFSKAKANTKEYSIQMGSLQFQCLALAQREGALNRRSSSYDTLLCYRRSRKRTGY